MKAKGSSEESRIKMECGERRGEGQVIQLKIDTSWVICYKQRSWKGQRIREVGDGCITLLSSEST